MPIRSVGPGRHSPSRGFRRRRKPTTSLRLVVFATLGLAPSLGHAATFAFACSEETTIHVDGLGARVDQASKRPTIYVIDDTAQKVSTFMPDRRALRDLCAGVQHCDVKVGTDEVHVTGIDYLAVSKLSSRLTIERKLGRGVREQTIDHENLDTAYVTTPLTCAPIDPPALD